GDAIIGLANANEANDGLATVHACRLSRVGTNDIHARPFSLTIAHVSSSALLKQFIISSISASVMINGGQKATLSPGMLRNIAPWCCARRTRYAATPAMPSR